MSNNLTTIKDNFMPKEWSSFRITLILYFVILLMPLSFYFVYSSFQTMQKDTNIVRKSSWTAGAMQNIALTQSAQDTPTIDKTLQDISLWVNENSNSELYIGEQTLDKDFLEVSSCWKSYKKDLITGNQPSIQEHAVKCYEKGEKLALIVEKMVYLKQKKLINLFYASLTIAMLLILLLIYLVRIYIHNQMKKHAIHDHESRLFNKKYFMSELKISCSRSTRHNYPLSLLHISINDFEKGNKTYSPRVKTNTLKVFGMLIHDLVRDGDIPCRYGENDFLILLPFTEEHNALVLEERIKEALKKDKWLSSKKITFEFNTTEFDKKESEEELIQRTLV